MDLTTHTHLTADWRSAAARRRSCVHSCSIVIGNVDRMKPANPMAAFGAFHPARRGVPSP